MQKKILFFLFLVLSLALIFCSCGTDPDPEPVSPQGQNTEQPADDGKVSIAFINSSSYAVNVFVNAHRRLGGSVLATVPVGQTVNKKLSPSATSTGDAFYFEYIIPIGSVSFPYFSYNNSQAYVVASGKQNQVTIGELASCSTKSSYLLIENQTSSTVYLVNGSTILTPETQTSYYIDTGKDGVFLLGQNNEAIYYQNTQLLKIQIGTKTVSLPDITFALGNIYTVVVTDTGASLKSVSPFDIDTQKQIWSFVHTGALLFDPDQSIQPCMRQAETLSDGTYIMGTQLADKRYIQVHHLDVYGKISTVGDAIAYKPSSRKEYTHDTSMVYDFIRLSDGSFVVLLENYYTKDDDFDWDDYLLCYDFEHRELKWALDVTVDKANSGFLVFWHDTSKRLVRVSDTQFVIAGQLCRTENENFNTYLYFADIVVAENEGKQSALVQHEFVSETASDSQMFTSVYYDGVDYYVCGYEDWDSSYEDLDHKGVVYKISADFSSAQEIYSRDRCLFFSIDGDGKTGKYAVCGEYCDTGKVLKGCFVTSAMIAENENEVVYTDTVSTGRAHCWFLHFCYYNNMLVLCGKSCADFSGNNSSLPMVVAYNADNKLLWENHSFTAYTDALNIVPNAIGTYLLQLSNENTSKMCYVNADLLGNQK